MGRTTALALALVFVAVVPIVTVLGEEWILTPSHRTSRLHLAHQFVPLDGVSFVFRREVEGNFCREWEGSNRRTLSQPSGEARCTAAVLDARPHEPQKYTCVLTRVWFSEDETPNYRTEALSVSGTYRCGFEGVPIGLYYMQLLDTADVIPKCAEFVSVGLKPFATMMAMKLAQPTGEEIGGRLYTDFVRRNVALEEEHVQLVQRVEDIAIAVHENAAVPLFHVYERDEVALSNTIDIVKFLRARNPHMIFLVMLRNTPVQASLQLVFKTLHPGAFLPLDRFSTTETILQFLAPIMANVPDHHERTTKFQGDFKRNAVVDDAAVLLVEAGSCVEVLLTIPGKLGFAERQGLVGTASLGEPNIVRYCAPLDIEAELKERFVVTSSHDSGFGAAYFHVTVEPKPCDRAADDDVVVHVDSTEPVEVFSFRDLERAKDISEREFSKLFSLEPYGDADKQEGLQLCQLPLRTASHEEEDVFSFRRVPISESGLNTRRNGPTQFVPPNCGYGAYFSTTALPGSFCTPMHLSAPAIAVDFDHDGWQDTVISPLHGRPVFYRNTRGSEGIHFQDVSESLYSHHLPNPSWCFATILIDIDNDGDLDMYHTCRERGYLFIFCEDEGRFCSEEALERGAAIPSPFHHGPSSVSFGDYDLDGFQDMYVTEWLDDRHKSAAARPTSHARLLRNLGGAGHPGYFEDVTSLARVETYDHSNRSIFALPTGEYGLCSGWADMDGDGWPDLVISGDFSLSTIYWNDGASGKFSEASWQDGNISTEENGMGTLIHDFNGDGLMDWFVTSIFTDSPSQEQCTKSVICNVGWSGNRLYINQGNRTFADMTDVYGVRDSAWGWGTEARDFDHDSLVDLVVVNGFHDNSHTLEHKFQFTPNQYWKRVDESTFEHREEEVGFITDGDARGIAAADFDRDGDLDVLIGLTHDYPELWENQLNNPSNHFLRIRPEFESGAPAIGTNVMASFEINGATKNVSWTIGHCGSHYHSQGEAIAHFGLGAATLAQVTITSPVQKTVVHLFNVPADCELLVTVREAGERLEDMDLQGSLKGVSECSLFAPGEAIQTTLADVHWSTGVLKDKDIRFGKIFEDQSEPTPGRQDGCHSTSFDVALDLLDEAPLESYTFDGSGNNKDHPSWGAERKLWRKYPTFYADGVSEPSGGDRPSARLISNEIFDQGVSVPNKRRLNALSMDWGQFVAHDIALVNPLRNLHLDSNLPIPVPPGDLWFDPDNDGDVAMRFTRANFLSNVGEDEPRQHVNFHTSFIDASNVYGNAADRAAALRTNEGGKLMDDMGLLPENSARRGLDCDNPMARNPSSLHLAGDHRANEQPGLFILHSVFLREHNRLCDLLKEKHPQWSDQELYDAARSLVTAEIQIITYEEYLPAILGENSDFLPVCDAYDSEVRGEVFAAFSAAAFRFGHSGVSGHLNAFSRARESVRDNGNPCKRRQVSSRSLANKISLRDAFFTPELISVNGMEAILTGQLQCFAEEVDHLMVHDLRNLLFGQRNSGGLDLAAMSIQRGRDMGLPHYNAARELLGLQRLRAFADIPTADADLMLKIAELYPSINDVDLFVGGLVEEHIPGGSVGPLWASIMKDQFEHLCKGDRLFYKWALSDEARALVGSAVTLKNVLARNLNVAFEANETSAFFGSIAC